MVGFLDIFGARRRQKPRISVRWLVDAKIPDTESYAGFTTCDVSMVGMRLVGKSSASFKQILTAEDLADMRLRIPGSVHLLPAVTAELKWGMGPEGNFQTGWRFTRLEEELEVFLEDDIAAHPEDIIVDPRDSSSSCPLLSNDFMGRAIQCPAEPCDNFFIYVVLSLFQYFPEASVADAGNLC